MAEQTCNYQTSALFTLLSFEAQVPVPLPEFRMPKKLQLPNLPLSLRSLGLLYVCNKICFSPVNLSFANLTIRQPKELRREEGKIFLSLHDSVYINIHVFSNFTEYLYYMQCTLINSHFFHSVLFFFN